MAKKYRKLSISPFFRVNRQLRNKMHNKWMVFCLVFIIVMPFVIALGLIIKSSTLFENHSLWEPGTFPLLSLKV